MSTTDDVAAGSNDSTMNLLRLFEAQPKHHVITRQDLTRDYDKCHAGPLSSDSSTTTINNYFTWNSSSTNASIHKEKAAIISMLHAVKSTSFPGSRSTSSWSSPFPSPSKSFTRSHRIQDIVSMCSEERCSFSADDYEAVVVAVDGSLANALGTDGRISDPWLDLPAAITVTDQRRPLFDRVSRCWSCTHGAAENDAKDDDDDNDNNDDETTFATVNRCRIRPTRPTTKKRNLLTRLTRFTKKSNRRMPK